ncbi:MAG: transposon-transfer assisting family protein [Clostridia bacterium]|nr:transposon-transfer assisting family protein [Clostridia bacterium]
MERFTIEEINLMCIYDTGTRSGLIAALTDTLGYLQADEAELRTLAESVISRLNAMTDAEYAQLMPSLIPDYGETEG